VQRRIFGSKRGEVTAESCIQFMFSFIICIVKKCSEYFKIKEDEMGGACRSHLEMRNACVLVGEKRKFGRPRRGWNNT
jgi:hypothetical protein